MFNNFNLSPSELGDFATLREAFPTPNFVSSSSKIDSNRSMPYRLSF